MVTFPVLDTSKLGFCTHCFAVVLWRVKQKSAELLISVSSVYKALTSRTLFTRKINVPYSDVFSAIWQYRLLLYSLVRLYVIHIMEMPDFCRKFLHNMLDMKWNGIKLLLWKHGKRINLCVQYRHFIPSWYCWSFPLTSPLFSGNLSLKLLFPLSFWLTFFLQAVVMLHMRTAQCRKAAFYSCFVLFSARA